jgi:hypothetical protein
MQGEYSMSACSLSLPLALIGFSARQIKVLQYYKIGQLTAKLSFASALSHLQPA